MSSRLIFNTGLLKQIPPFSLLSPEKLELLYRTARRQRYERGATILEPNERAAGVYVLLSGRAKVVVDDGQGRAMTLSFIDRKEFFGSTGLIDEDEPCPGVEALEVCETLFIPRAAFLECIEGNYGAAMQILRVVEARLHKAYMKLASLGLVDVYGRVARVLVESAQEVNGQWIVDTGAEEIARTVAASREMVSRVVKNMREKGLVRTERRKTVILDRQSMNAACAP